MGLSPRLRVPGWWPQVQPCTPAPLGTTSRRSMVVLASDVPGGRGRNEQRGAATSAGSSSEGPSCGTRSLMAGASACRPLPTLGQRHTHPGAAAYAGRQGPQWPRGSRPPGRAPSTWPESAAAPGPARPAAGPPGAGPGSRRAAAAPPPAPGGPASGGPCLRGPSCLTLLGPSRPPPHVQPEEGRSGLPSSSWVRWGRAASLGCLPCP